MVTVEYQVGASEDDGYWYGASGFSNSASSLYLGVGASTLYKTFIRFPAVIIPDGVTFNEAYLSFYYSGKQGTPIECDLYGESAANPSAVSSRNDGESRTKTSVSVKITSPVSGTWWTKDIKTIIEDLAGDFSYKDGAAMQFFIIPPAPTGTANFGQCRAYDYSGNVTGPKLTIIYTEAAGKPAANVIWIG